MIEVADLCKWFGGPRGSKLTAVDRVSFQVKAGEIFGLLGPNGAGKTTTLRILATVLRPSSGSATVAGFDVATQGDEVRRRIGYLSASTGVYDRMTPWEMVSYYARLHGLAGASLNERMDRLFTELKMNDFRHRRCGQLSTGMRQKTSIARALIHDPPVLIFDEPTAGLDVLVQRAVLRQIADLRSAGKCVVFSTHTMHEAEKLCQRIAIMSQGAIVDCGTTQELRARHGEHDLEELFFQLVGAPDNQNGS